MSSRFCPICLSLLSTLFGILIISLSCEHNFLPSPVSPFRELIEPGVGLEANFTLQHYNVCCDLGNRGMCIYVKVEVGGS